MNSKQAWKTLTLDCGPAKPIAVNGALQVFFCGGCRYRVTAYRDWPVHRVKQALFAGGIARANKPDGIRNTPGIRKWEDLVRIPLGHWETAGMTDQHCIPSGRS